MPVIEAENRIYYKQLQHTAKADCFCKPKNSLWVLCHSGGTVVEGVVKITLANLTDLRKENPFYLSLWCFIERPDNTFQAELFVTLSNMTDSNSPGPKNYWVLISFPQLVFESFPAQFQRPARTQENTTKWPLCPFLTDFPEQNFARNSKQRNKT